MPAVRRCCELAVATAAAAEALRSATRGQRASNQLGTLCPQVGSRCGEVGAAGVSLPGHGQGRHSGCRSVCTSAG